MYNIPIITISNIDNIVYRDVPYNLNFSITAPTLTSPIVEDVEFSSSYPIPDGSETDLAYEYNIDKNEWTFDNDGNVEIFNLEMIGEDQNVLSITGMKLIRYSYKVYFNQEEIKSGYNLSTDISSAVLISSAYFNNFVDGQVIIEVTYGNSLTQSKSFNLQLVNTEPYILFGDIINNKLDLTITDNESDPIKLNIKVNGKNYYPSNGEFTDYVQTPYFYSSYIPSNILNVDPYNFTTPNNIITVTVVDSYGGQTQMHKSFIGEFIGILFVDENNEFYSDDTNNYVDDANILKEQKLGEIRAGMQSDKKITYLLNKTNFKLTNIKLVLNTIGIPDGTHVRIGKTLSTDFNQMSPDILEFENLELNVGQKIPFYVQANTSILSMGGGYYYIDVIADPVS